MKKKVIIIASAAVVLAAVITGALILMNSGKSETHDEGASEKQSEISWTSKQDKKQHKTAVYSYGKTAEALKEELSDEITLEHRSVDDVFVYEMHQGGEKNQKLLFFLHGQTSRKEEYLNEMLNYVDSGYYCVTVDLPGYGERITEKPLMSLEITRQASKDIDLLLDYYESRAIANAGNFAIIGLSQGGSAAYMYAAYGERTPKAIVAGSSTPDLTYFVDNTCIANGKNVDAVWSEKQINEFIKKNNPVNQLEKFYTLPVMAGNSVDDPIVSYKGSEAFELKIKDKNKNVSFYYFDGTKHNVSEGFMQNIPNFLEKYMK